MISLSRGLPNRRLLQALVFGMFGMSSAAAQGAPVQRIERVDAVAPEPFSLIKGFRELSDGRVIVTDWIEERVTVVDFDRGTARDLGRIGGGPKEFRLPGQLVALPGDSTLLTDVGNARLTVIGPDLEFGRSMSVHAHGEAYAMSPRAADERGNLYFQLSPWASGSGMGPSDSVPIGRWGPPAEAVSFVGDVKIKTYTSKPSGPSMGLPYVAFAKQDDWALASDGWVAVLRSDPYRVEWYGPDGQRVFGPVIEYERLPVTTEDRRDHVRWFLMSTMQSGRGEDGGMGHVPAAAQSQVEINRIARDGLFADEFPPFVPGGVWLASDDRLWVQRSLPVEEPPTFDVFDRTGRRIAAVTLPPGRRIVGMGRGTVYTTVADDDDLLSLERYRTPALPPR